MATDIPAAIVDELVRTHCCTVGKLVDTSTERVRPTYYYGVFIIAVLKASRIGIGSKLCCQSHLRALERLSKIILGNIENANSTFTTVDNLVP